MGLRRPLGNASRIFLRTTEFLWQEGHTVHETEAEAREETKRMLDVYETFVRDHLAIPVYSGEKSESERFPGAVQTLAIEAMVQDRKAIQAGTSHFLGQNFSAERNPISSAMAKRNLAGPRAGARARGWSPRDHDPQRSRWPRFSPRIAPTHIVIIPITPKEETRAAVLQAAQTLASQLREVNFHGAPIEVELDQRDLGGGVKNWEWIKKGVPLRVELGPRDLESGNVAVSRRDQPVKNKRDSICCRIRQARDEFDSIQLNLFERAEQFRDTHTRVIDSKEEFYDFFTSKKSDKPEIHGGFALAHWDGSREVEEQIKNDLKVTIRVIPFSEAEPGKCIFTGQQSVRRVVWAKSY